MTGSYETKFRYAVKIGDELVWHDALGGIDGRLRANGEEEAATLSAESAGAGGRNAEQPHAANAVRIGFGSTRPGDRVHLTITDCGPGVRRLQWRIESDAAVEWVMLDSPVGADEHFYGFGETYGELDQRGKELRLWVENGCVRDLSYKPVPFYVSSAGYGIYLEHRELIYARMATPDIGGRVQLKVASGELNVYRFEADDIPGIIDRYTTIVGKPTLPPPWFFGAWKSRDWRTENQSSVLLDLTKQRELGIPCSVKLIDAAWERELNDFRFHPDKFPDFGAVMETARRLDYQVVLWISPWVAEWTDIYKELDAKGFFPRTPDGRTYVHRLGNSPNLLGSMIDFTNPDAVRWWQERIESLMELGVRGIKTDFGEQVPEDAVFHDGSTGKTMHNYYPVLYNRVTHDVVKRYNGILLGRSAWAGSQAFTGIWAGDQTADFAPRSGMLATIFAGQSVGVCGFPYWGSDIGGYFGTPDREVFIRWTQYAAFTPCMELHGLGERDPWDMDAEALEQYKRYASLHTRLLPYLYPLAIEGSERGLPMMRAMMIHYNDDPNVHRLPCVGYQYMLGKDMLVAPVFFEGGNRELYLPEGAWIDLWSGSKREGPWHGRVRAPLDETPVWLRAGVVIPLLSDGTETIGNFADPERWMEALGTACWEFLLAPGEGRLRQGGVEIVQSADAGGAGGIVSVQSDRDLGIVPDRLLLKIRVPLDEERSYRCSIRAADGAGRPLADGDWDIRRCSWESGIWIRLPAGCGSADIRWSAESS